MIYIKIGMIPVIIKGKLMIVNFIILLLENNKIVLEMP